MRLLADPRFFRVVGIVISAVLAIAALFGQTIDIPVIDPVFPVE